MDQSNVAQAPDYPVAEITLFTHTGPATVTAIINGPLAVHQAHDADGWTVSHVASGRALAIGLASREAALALMAELVALADWSQARHTVPGRKPDGITDEQFAAAKAAIAWALAIGESC